MKTLPVLLIFLILVFVERRADTRFARGSGNAQRGSWEIIA